MDGYDSDGEDALPADDPVLNWCICALLVVLVVAVCLVATGTTIFDKMKGRPLTTTDAIIGICSILVGGCICMGCISYRENATTPTVTNEASIVAATAAAAMRHSINGNVV
jgi:hypothetical protein